ncbi:hypothetical protein JCM17960_30680 [Magnetospira thiophila]
MMNKGPTNNKRPRARNGKRHPGGNKNQSFDSNGPEVRVRGTAHQVLEKYLSLARDASSAGDRITAEGYYQHAEHYYRIISAQAENAQNRPPRTPGQDRMMSEPLPEEVGQTTHGKSNLDESDSDDESEDRDDDSDNDNDDDADQGNEDGDSTVSAA